MQYSVPLALEDYLTVIFSAIGMILLTRMIWQLDRALGRMALVGTVLTATGGLLKASGKLVMALGGPDLPALNMGLFPLIAPGLTLMAWSLYQVRRAMRGQAPQRQRWLVPLLLIALFTTGSLALGLAGGPWRVVLILQSTLANLAVLTMLIAAAWGRRMWLTGALFLTTLVTVLVMSQLANMPIQSIGMVWFEQITQTIAQALFALAAWQYGQRIEATYGGRLVAQPA
ncbi:MAG TPA: hypothetical protein PKD53_23415 [Chloroflexaceae bacterium]|nr:hypothetical protein [Chloroflexaceae bacterium]